MMLGLAGVSACAANGERASVAVAKSAENVNLESVFIGSENSMAQDDWDNHGRVRGELLCLAFLMDTSCMMDEAIL